jgi:hypothetical protein
MFDIQADREPDGKGVAAPSAISRANGRITMNVAPWPGVLSSLTVPP